MSDRGFHSRGLIVASLTVIAIIGLAGALFAESLPPAPSRYFNDGAKIIAPASADKLNAQLETFERETSNQVLVAIFPHLPTDMVMEDFTQRTAEAWGVGGKQRDNGVVLFIFPHDRKMRIEVGYGLEGALPDITAQQILDNQIRPAFRAGDFNGGVTRGVDAILSAIRGEYQGSGRTVADTHPSNSPPENSLDGWFILLPFFFIFLFVFTVITHAIAHARNGTSYDKKGRRTTRNHPWSTTSWGGFGGGGGSSGGGGFSGGGGSFGGGGASGGW